MSVISFLHSKTTDIWLKVSNKHLRDAFGVNSHLTIRERVVLYSLARDGKWLSEIGSYIGASACCFGVALEEKGIGKLICIDTWNNDAMSEGRRNTWQEFQENTDRFRNLILPIRGFSTDVVDQVREKTDRLDLLFIDGDHSYEGVKADWESYKTFLQVGSIVIFHDYGWAEGVKRVVQEDVMPLVSSFERLPNMWWGSIGQGP